ncbi:hypothetical protein [Nocardia speluncae]|uniref:hypothetical protein n=1 Tax=Nocardia speluncae TaxID=419477 RepID=UPI001FDEAAFC|nr:hypothetical protein [Nocardia speluncae]
MTAWDATCDAGFGPYTVLDLYDLPEDGKGFELEDGWLVEVAAGARHHWIARRLSRIIEGAWWSRWSHPAAVASAPTGCGR